MVRLLASAYAEGRAGYAYGNDDGVPQDRAKGLELLGRASDLGHPSAKRFMEGRA